MANPNEIPGNDSYSMPVQKVLIVGESKTAQIDFWIEAKATTVTTGNNDGLIDPYKGTVDQMLETVSFAVPGGIGNIYAKFYDGTVSALSSMTGPLYLANQPNEGFDLKGTKLTSGILGFRIAGWTSGGSNLFVTAKYTYKKGI